MTQHHDNEKALALAHRLFDTLRAAKLSNEDCWIAATSLLLMILSAASPQFRVELAENLKRSIPDMLVAAADIAAARAKSAGYQA